VRLEFVDIDEALKAGQAVEPVKEMQLSWAIAEGTRLASSAHAAVVVNCAARRRTGIIVRWDLRRLRTRHSSLWMEGNSTSSSPCAVRESDAPLAALCCSSVRTRAPISILLPFKTGGPETERLIVVYPGLRYRSLASVCNARSPRIEGVVERALAVRAEEIELRVVHADSLPIGVV
jgi:hypothetical protein